ncbi:MAG: NAD(P)/FAD-dependent oxidoreductase [Candidatus Micrarchaeota archaeon]|nr:NAD(P)/FAD-dependent oxidoreductase [Candidatus Micrarchaeota archaeon]
MANDPTEEKIYDAIVVGAGPAGCSCALFLANAGREVLLVDKAASFPREKVCGDAFSGKSIGVARELGVLPNLEKKPHGIVRGLTLIAPNGKHVSVPFPNADGMPFAGYTVARFDTDEVFFRAASAHPKIAVLLGFSPDELLREGDAITGVAGALGADKKRMAFKARVVVGADGAASAVSRLLKLPNQPVNHVYSGVRGYYTGVEGLTENIELFFIDGVLPGYLWIFPMANGRANVGLGILSSDLNRERKHPNAMLADAIEKNSSIAPRFKNALLDGRMGGWAIPLGSYRKKCFGDGWMLIGDAASLVDPFSGEGVGNSLCSGKYAAVTIGEAIVKAPGSAPLSESALAGYGKLLDEYIYPEMVDSYRLQRASRFRFLLNMFIGKAADKPEARQMLVNMVNSDEEKKKTQSPLFYLKLLLP